MAAGSRQRTGYDRLLLALDAFLLTTAIAGPALLLASLLSESGVALYEFVALPAYALVAAVALGSAGLALRLHARALSIPLISGLALVVLCFVFVLIFFYGNMDFRLAAHPRLVRAGLLVIMAATAALPLLDAMNDLRAGRRGHIGLDWLRLAAACVLVALGVLVVWFLDVGDPTALLELGLVGSAALAAAISALGADALALQRDLIWLRVVGAIALGVLAAVATFIALVVLVNSELPFWASTWPFVALPLEVPVTLGAAVLGFGARPGASRGAAGWLRDAVLVLGSSGGGFYVGMIVALLLLEGVTRVGPTRGLVFSSLAYVGAAIAAGICIMRVRAGRRRQAPAAGASEQALPAVNAPQVG